MQIVKIRIQDNTTGNEYRIDALDADMARDWLFEMVEIIGSRSHIVPALTILYFERETING